MKFFEKKKFTGLHLRVCSRSLFSFFFFPPPLLHLELDVNFSKKGMEEIQSIKIPNFSVSQCDSLSGPHVQRENPSLPQMSLLLACAHLHFTLQRWRGVQRLANIWHSPLIVSRFQKNTHARACAHRISQLSAPATASKSILTLTAQSCRTQKKTRQTLFCSGPLSSSKCLIHVYTY